MTLLENLQNHKGSLLRLKTELYWPAHRGWDGNPGRICLILDADAAPPAKVTVASTAAVACATATTARTATAARLAAVRPPITEVAASVLLLIDGATQWIWVAEADVEVISETG